MNDTVRQQLDDFFSRYTKLRYRKGEVIVRADDSPAGIYYLKKGFVRMIATAGSGETLVMHVFKPGSFFPMMWGINDAQNRYQFEAVNESEAYRAPREEVVRFVKQNPDVLFDLASRLLSGTSGLLQRMEHLVLDSAYDKTVKLLSYYVRNFGTPDTKSDGTVIVLTHREVAAWIGTTRETASLQIEALVKKGLASYRGRQLVVKDIRKLEQEVG